MQTEAHWLRSQIDALRRRAESLVGVDRVSRERMEQIVAACTMMELQMDLDELSVVDVYGGGDDVQ